MAIDNQSSDILKTLSMFMVVAGVQECGSVFELCL